MVRLKGRKVYMLAYVDNIALLAENEESLKEMMERLERYLDRKGLKLNVGKTKVMRCRKGEFRWKKELDWKE